MHIWACCWMGVILNQWLSTLQVVCSQKGVDVMNLNQWLFLPAFMRYLQCLDTIRMSLKHIHTNYIVLVSLPLLPSPTPCIPHYHDVFAAENKIFNWMCIINHSGYNDTLIIIVSAYIRVHLYTVFNSLCDNNYFVDLIWSLATVHLVQQCVTSSNIYPQALSL